MVDTCIFAKADGLLVEYNDGRSGPSNLKSRAGIVKYPTFQVCPASPVTRHPYSSFSRSFTAALCQVYKGRVLVAELSGEELEATKFDAELRRIISEALAAEPSPLRLVGFGATRKQFDEAANGGGGGGGGRRGGSGGGGGASRSFE